MKTEGPYGLYVDLWELLYTSVGVMVECREKWSELLT